MNVIKPTINKLRANDTVSSLRHFRIFYA